MTYATTTTSSKATGTIQAYSGSPGGDGAFTTVQIYGCWPTAVTVADMMSLSFPIAFTIPTGGSCCYVFSYANSTAGAIVYSPSTTQKGSC